ncbi:chitinase [Podospora aff. communis PSN243]|uniref:chitinase n=1 Tax=Podospora aff. communis PSN243 TaxID=3040156 RepID=A0AAV9G391_9PEZI|nr:chitinase [Podospora aff. communis PSN243]
MRLLTTALVVAGIFCSASQAASQEIRLDPETGAAQTFRVHSETGAILHRRGDSEEDEEPDWTCGPGKPCEIGCCGQVNQEGVGVCGMGPTYCGPGNCTSSCTAKSDCDPGWGMEYSLASSCPLNVCCSKFGFCGVSDDFCEGRRVASPECAIEDGTSDKRTIGYYEGWNLARPCGTMKPKEIPLGWYTHLNFAFALIHPTTFHVAPMDSKTPKLYKAVTALKDQQEGLEVWIAIGGWAMNDEGPYRTAFSDMAGSTANQDVFFESLIKFMEENNFDGVDIDWEYPVAPDRGGRPADFNNYATFLRRLRERLNRTGKRYGISIAIPASYWYLRGFNLQELEPWIDWFNIMTYDIHGTWDSHVRAIGSKAYAHTNLTEIQMGLELLWRNNVNPERVNLGLGFYGRSFTMEDPNCMAPGCPFKNATGAGAGACTGTPGVLSAAEINEIIANGGVQTFYPEEAVQVVTWDTDQWVSWDDAVTLKMKMDYANQRCLGGTMVWAIDLDDGTLLEALASNLNRNISYASAPSLYTCSLGTHGGPIYDYDDDHDEL